jgi:hypothetical protein
MKAMHAKIGNLNFTDVEKECQQIWDKSAAREEYEREYN